MGGGALSFRRRDLTTATWLACRRADAGLPDAKACVLSYPPELPLVDTTFQASRGFLDSVHERLSGL